MTRLLILLLTLGLLSSCQENRPTTSKNNPIPLGNWRGVLHIDTTSSVLELPFNFEVLSDNKIIIHNGEERIEVSDITIDSQNISIKMPVFGSEFIVQHTNGILKGRWYNYNKKDYSIPFSATPNSPRFELPKESEPIPTRWQVSFSPDTEDYYPAIGLFKQQENGIVTGTFLTETGDYRYLQGTFDGQQLFLSCFDGAHAFLFHAHKKGDSLRGTFWSGKHWQEPWTAIPDSTFELARMDTLTYLKPGYDKLAFSLPDENGDTISLTDERFQDKPLIVQITGSWCPNCMDETRFLVEVYEKYKSKGLEIISIDFEAIDDFAVFQRNSKRIREHLGVTYPIVYGGYAKKSVAAETLPMLNHILSYPTAIFIGKDGDIKEIHTGFSGPGTGDRYLQYTQKTIALVEQLIQ